MHNRRRSRQRLTIRILNHLIHNILAIHVPQPHRCGRRSRIVRILVRLEDLNAFGERGDVDVTVFVGGEVVHAVSREELVDLLKFVRGQDLEDLDGAVHGVGDVEEVIDAGEAVGHLVASGYNFAAVSAGAECYISSADEWREVMLLYSQ